MATVYTTVSYNPLHSFVARCECLVTPSFNSLRYKTAVLDRVNSHQEVFCEESDNGVPP